MHYYLWACDRLSLGKASKALAHVSTNWEFSISFHFYFIFFLPWHPLIYYFLNWFNTFSWTENLDVLDRTPYYLKIGSSETLPCSLKNDTHIRWYIDGKVASTSGRQIKTSGDTLTINDIRVSDGGTYECRGLKYAKFFTIYVIGR